MTIDEPRHRRIRSYVLREGRLTAGQDRALKELWPLWGVEDSGRLDLDEIFQRSAPRALEIGFGNGQALIEHAERFPDIDFLGIEVHRPGVGRALLDVEKHELTNVRVMRADAIEVLSKQLSTASLDHIHLFFADPWHKKKHHKRRIVQPWFAALCAAALKPGGALYMATDWQEYAEHMQEVMKQSPEFKQADADVALPRPDTHFERRGLKLGHEISDLFYQRISHGEQTCP